MNQATPGTVFAAGVLATKDMPACENETPTTSKMSFLVVSAPSATITTALTTIDATLPVDIAMAHGSDLGKMAAHQGQKCPNTFHA